MMMIGKDKVITAILWLACATLLISGPVSAEPKPVSESLSPRLNQLLTEEMRSIRQAMGQIFNGIVVGDSSVVANMAEQIHNSFILMRQLTDKDKKDLNALPPEFLEMDGQFHATAEKLAAAGKHKDLELQRYYFAKLTESCVACHSRYVTDKFPAFSGRAAEGGHGH